MAGLRRHLGTFGAVMLGLGSMVGTGVFVSIALGAEAAGENVVVAVMLAALVAACNGLSSAQLAARYPTSGGTYEYGYQRLNPTLGFVAGWTFLTAKTFSAATAALGFAGYTISALRLSPDLRIPFALGAVILLTLLVLAGIRRSSQVNTIIVTITLGALLALIAFGLPDALDAPPAMSPADDGEGSLAGLLRATALLFVAYTGYGRVATLGEEVRDPGRTIPRAIIIVLVVTAALYAAVAFVALGVLGPEGLAGTAEGESAPLIAVARALESPALVWLLTLGAITAMLGVVLNLILGLSRVVLAMGRRGDMPVATSRVNAKGTAPVVATVMVGAVMALLVLIGDVGITWSFSAFAVLVYYAVTNLAALRLTKSERLFPRWIALVGLVFCLGLAFFVDVRTWAIGLGLIVVGLGWQQMMKRLRRPT